jgi:hypothetical protein
VFEHGGLIRIVLQLIQWHRQARRALLEMLVVMLKLVLEMLVVMRKLVLVMVKV